MTEFEMKIWRDFWQVANDPELQGEMGIRANHGQVSYVVASKGKTYQVNLRASDGISLNTLPE